MGDGIGRVHEKIRSFQKKYYLNLFIRGTILTLSILLGYFLLVSLLEHNLWMSPGLRLAIFLTFFAVAAVCVYRFLNQPLQWWVARRGMSEEQSAKLIGSSLPTVKDRLLNLLQLSSSSRESALSYASVQQKSRELDPLTFDTVIDLRENRRYLKYLAIPVCLVLLILLFNRNILTDSTDRLVHFNREYSPQAPFEFIVQNESLEAFYNEDFVFKVLLEGSAVPDNAYLVSNNQRLKLLNLGDGQFQYVFEKVQKPMSLQIEAAGFYSDAFEIKLINRPELVRFNVELDYPRYIQRRNEKISNAGNLEIPEGTTVTWKLNTSNTKDAAIKFAASPNLNAFQPGGAQAFSYSKKFLNPDQYEITLQNEESKNRERIAYHVEVIKDQHPQISVSNYRDSVLYKRVILGGAIADDYGVTQLSLHFRIRNEQQDEVLKSSVRIPPESSFSKISFTTGLSIP
jgi:hypothetical protein